MNPTGSSQFRLMFEPWVPKKFNWKGLRLLVVAESHYDENRSYGVRDTRKFTQEVIKSWGSSCEESLPFFKKIALTFVGDSVVRTDDKFAEFWNSIAFCNYVQKFVKGRPSGSRAFPEDIRRSDRAFRIALNRVRPDAVVIMSEKVWQNMSEEGAYLFSNDVSGIGKIYRYRFARGTCLVGHTHHPMARGRSYFDPAAWRTRVNKFLGIARRQLRAR